MLKPKRVLCKRTYSLGDEETWIGFKKVKLDNRWYIEGQWYDVVYNENDTDETFSVRNHQGDTELFFMYESDDENLTRTYKKWFYSAQEIREMKLNQLGLCEI
jgi:hypothetical protein